MKISAYKIEQTVASPDPKLCIFLLFGPDRGLSMRYFDMLAQHFAPDIDDPFSVAQLSIDQLIDEPNLLIEEAQTISLTGEKKTILIKHCDDTCWGAFDALLTFEQINANIVVRAGELGVRSKLRQKLEAHPRAGVIGCYANAKDTSMLLKDALAKDDISIDPQAKQFLLASLGDDLAIKSNAIEMYCLYAGKNGHLDIEDVKACAFGNDSLHMDEIAMVASEGNAYELDHLILDAWQAGQQPVQMMRMVCNHLLRLWQAVELIEAGHDANSAMKHLRPPVFFKQIERFRRQISIWPRPRILQALQLVQACDRTLRKTGMPTKIIAGRCLHQLASMARKKMADKR